MPLFLIERNFAETLEVNRDKVTEVTQVNDDVGIQWLFSFLSADKKKTYCLYEAPSAEAIREAARRLNVPADVIVESGRTATGDVRVSGGAYRKGRGRMALATGTSPFAPLCAKGEPSPPSVANPSAVSHLC